MTEVGHGLFVETARIVRDDRWLGKRVVVLSGGDSLSYIETPSVLIKWTG